jgi:hypothetical protein
MKTALFTILILIGHIAIAQDATALRCYNQPYVSADSPYLVALQDISSKQQLKVFVKELTKDKVIRVESKTTLKAIGMDLLTLSVNTEHIFFPAVLGFDQNAAIDDLVARTIQEAAQAAGITEYIIDCNDLVHTQPKAGGIN